MRPARLLVQLADRCRCRDPPSPRPAGPASAPSSPGRCATTTCARSNSSRQRCQFGRPRNASMPSSRHSERSGYSRAQLGQCVHGIGRRRCGALRDRRRRTRSGPATAALTMASAQLGVGERAARDAADCRWAGSAPPRASAPATARKPCAGARSGWDRTCRRRDRWVACAVTLFRPRGSRQRQERGAPQMSTASSAISSQASPGQRAP